MRDKTNTTMDHGYLCSTVIYNILNNSHKIPFELCKIIVSYLCPNKDNIKICYEKQLDASIVKPQVIQIHWGDFLDGMVKCIFYKKYVLNDDQCLVPYLRNDVMYFENHDEIDCFVQNKINNIFCTPYTTGYINTIQYDNQILYLMMIMSISNFVESYSAMLRFGKNDKINIYNIHFHNKNGGFSKEISNIICNIFI